MNSIYHQYNKIKLKSHHINNKFQIIIINIHNLNNLNNLTNIIQEQILLTKNDFKEN